MSVLLLTIDLHLSMIERQEKIAAAALSSPSMEFVSIERSECEFFVVIRSAAVKHQLF